MLESVLEAVRPAQPLPEPKKFGGRPNPADRFAGTAEPSLTELMEDPILHRLMASDGIHRQVLDRLVEQARQRLTR